MRFLVFVLVCSWCVLFFWFWRFTGGFWFEKKIVTGGRFLQVFRKGVCASAKRLHAHHDAEHHTPLCGFCYEKDAGRYFLEPGSGYHVFRRRIFVTSHGVHLVSYFAGQCLVSPVGYAASQKKEGEV